MLKEFIEEKKSYGEMAKILGRSKSSVWMEVKKSGGFNHYDPYKSEERYRRGRISRKKRRTLEISSGLQRYVIARLKEEWSPEQISAVLRILSKGRCIISHETIYQFLYSEAGKELKLWIYLRHKKRPKRRHWGTRKRRVSIPFRVSIHNRPKRVDLREEFGHWEGDLMQFSKSRSTLAVFVERTTRRTIAIVNKNKTAEEMRFALYEVLSTAGQKNVSSITFDNGLENVCHEQVRKEYSYSFDTYFCDPYSSWQKGLVENTNKLLRQYFPRDIDPSLITQDNLDTVVQKPNNRPRKCLNFNSPINVFRYRSF